MPSKGFAAFNDIKRTKADVDVVAMISYEREGH
jgi:hypothetical protein